MVEIEVKNIRTGEVVYRCKTKKELVQYIKTVRPYYTVAERTTYDNLAYVMQPELRIIRNGKELMY